MPPEFYSAQVSVDIRFTLGYDIRLVTEAERVFEVFLRFESLFLCALDTFLTGRTACKLSPPQDIKFGLQECTDLIAHGFIRFLCVILAADISVGLRTILDVPFSFGTHFEAGLLH